MDGGIIGLGKAGANNTTKRKRKTKVTAGIMALEPRVMFDGAALADAAHAAADVAAKALIPDVPAAIEVPAAVPAQDGGKKDVAFVDTGVSDWQSLVAGLQASQPGVEIQLLDTWQSGLAQMAKWADSHSGYDSIHIIARGGEGTLSLGADSVSDSTLGQAVTQAELAQIGHALKAGGELKLYGSNIGAGAAGLTFLNDLAQGTGAVVSAADHAVGDAAQGASWDLNISTGAVAVAPLSIAGYLGVLDFTASVTDAAPHAVQVQAADVALDGGKLEVAFVDTSVAQWEVLVADIRATRPGIEIELIDGTQSGLAQMADWAETHRGYGAVHVLSHGDQGELHLGTDILTGTSLEGARTQLSAIGGALTEQGDLLLYGCDIGNGVKGEDFIAALATATGADVAASTGATGARTLGGNWELELTSGSVEGLALEAGDYTDALILPSSTYAYPGHSLTQFRNGGFAALQSDGTMVSWGIGAFTASGVKQVFQTNSGFIALKEDGTIQLSSALPAAPAELIGLKVKEVFTAQQGGIAVLTEDGRVVSWGNSAMKSGYEQVKSQLQSGIKTIVSNEYAFAALTEDGHVVSWGTFEDPMMSQMAGRPAVNATAPAGLSNVVQVCVSSAAFAALKSDGTVVAWGNSQTGGSTANASAPLTDVVKIFSNVAGFVAVNASGGVSVWGSPSLTVGMSAVAGQLTSGVQEIVSNNGALAALKSNGQVVVWGSSTFSGSDPFGKTADPQYHTFVTESALASGVVKLFATNGAFAALKGDGTVVTWGQNGFGGNSSAVTLTNVSTIVSSAMAFAALKNDGSVVVWGDPLRGGVLSSPLTDVTSLVATEYAIAALKNDGTVVAWGLPNLGGSTGAIGSQLTNVTRIADIFAAPGPSIDYAAGSSTLYSGQSTTITFTLTESASNFTSSDVTVTGGTLSDFTGSGSTYTATFTPNANFRGTAQISVTNGAFTNAGGDNCVASSYSLSVDTRAPEVTAASISSSAAKVTLTFTQPLDATNPPPASAFTVTADGQSVAVQSLTITGKVVELTLARSVYNSASVTIAYTDPSGSDDSAAAQSAIGQDAASVTRIITNAAAVVTAGGTVSHTEGGAAVTIASALTITDSDDANIQSATISISSGFTAGDMLSVTTIPGVTSSYNSATGVLTISGTATKDQYQTILRSVQYYTTSDAPTATSASRTVSWKVTDSGAAGILGGRDSIAVTSTVTVAGVNDGPPVLDATQDAALKTTPIDAAVPTGLPVGATAIGRLINATNYSDVDGDRGGIAIIGKASTGTLYYTTNGGTTWTAVPAVAKDSALVLKDDGNTYLFYKPAASFSGTITNAITFRAWDQTGGYTNGQSGVNIQSTPTLVGSVDTPGFADELVVSADGKTAYVADAGGGLRAFDISNPASPVFLRSWTAANSAKDVAIDGTYAYVADGNAGLKVVKLSDMSTVGSLDTTTAFLSLEYSRGIAVLGKYAYIADGGEGLKVVDVSTPASPVLTGTFNTAGESWGVALRQVLEGSTLKTYAYVADGGNGLLVLDVTNPASITQKGRCDTAGTAYRVKLVGATAYVADDTAGVQIIDVTSSTAPTLIGTYNTPGNALALSVDGSLLYVADSGSGLQVIDISDPASPVLLRTTDTSGTAGGIALYGNYAYVADGNDGLKVLKVKESFSTQHDTAKVDVKLVPNTAPTVSGLSDVTWTESGTAGVAYTPVAIAANVVLGDTEQLNLSGLTLTISNSKTGDMLSLPNPQPAGITVKGSGTATLTLSGSALLADYQAILRRITFNNITDAPDTTARTITITANDGQSENNTTLATLSVSVITTNDAPYNSSTLPTPDGGWAVTVLEDTWSQCVPPGLWISDSDAGNANITVTATVSAGLLRSASSATVTVTGSDTNTVTLVGTAANISSFIGGNGLFYKGPADVSGASAATLIISANDGGNTGVGGGTTVTLKTVRVNITAVNDAPTITGAPTTSIPLNVGQAAALPTLTVADVDSTSLTLSITSPQVKSSTPLTLSGITDADAQTAGIQFRGTAAEINAALSALRMTATAAGSSPLRIQVSDGSANNSSVVNVIFTDATAANSAPTIADATIPSVVTGEKQALSSYIQVADADAGQNLVLTLTATNGEISGVVDGNSTVAGVQVYGTATQIAQALSTAKFTAAADGTASITASVTDGVETTPTSRTFTFTAAAVAPTLTTMGNLTGTENLPVRISFSDLLSASNAVDRGGSVDSFVVKSVTEGTLTIGGTAWDATTNCTIDADHTAVWTPQGGHTTGTGASALSAFVVVARDNSGTDSALPGVQVKVDVAHINAAPTLSNGTYSFTGIDENTTSGAVRVSNLLASATISDAETASSALGIVVTGSSALGHWQISTNSTTGSDGTWSNLGEVSAQTAKLLAPSTWIRYVPDGDHGETASFTYRVWDGSEGTAGGSADTSVTGGAAAYSSGTGTASVVVAEIDDPLTLTRVASATATYTENAQYVLDNALTLSDADNPSTALTASQVYISNGLAAAEDRLEINGATSGTLTIGSDSISYAYDTATGIMKLTGSAAQSSYQAALRMVQYVNISENPTTTAREITITGGDTQALYLNGQWHFYEYVSATSPRVSWSSARDAAAASTFLGMTGYLVTITSQAESDFITNHMLETVTSSAWIGASDAATEGTWKWVTGPEAGTTFYQVSIAGVSGSAVNGAFTNWGPVPNDSFGEDNGAILPDGSGQWNDMDGPTFGLTAAYDVNGYLIEYNSASISSVPFSKTITLTPQRVNDAPVLTSATPTMSAITEDATSNSGQLVSAIVNNSTISDVDSGAITGGIAITGLNSGNGTWQYRLNNTGDWLNMGALSDSSALLLRPADAIRFLPNGENATSASFTYRAWDQTAGTAGQTADTSTTGGTAAFSTGSNSASISVTALNDAPAFDSAITALFMSAISEDIDSAANQGQTVASFLGTALTDVDASAVNGIAITGSTALGSGVWEYSTNDGGSWTAIGNVSASNALLLRSTDLLRFSPDGIIGGTASLTVRGWDRTGGTAGQHADTGSNGGTTAFSAATRDVSLTVVPAEDPPELSTTSTGNATYLLGGAPVVVDPHVTLSDDGTLFVAAVQIANYNTGDLLSMTSQNGLVSYYIPQQGVLLVMSQPVYDFMINFFQTSDQQAVDGAVNDPMALIGDVLASLSSQPTLAQWQAALRSVTYSTTDTNPTANGADRQIIFSVMDDHLLMDEVKSNLSRTLTISTQPQAPVLASAPATFSYTEDDGARVIAPSLAVTDGDDTQLASAQVVLNPGSSGFNAATEMLGLSDTSLMTATAGGWTASVNGIALTYTAATGVLNLGGTASVQEYQSVLRSITYKNSTDYATAGALTGVNQRSITWRVTDANGLGAGAQQSTLSTTAITLLDANEAPQVGGANGNVAYSEGGAPVALAISLTASDDDSDSQLSGATLKIQGYTTGDSLNFTTQNGISGSFSNGTLSLTGTASVSAYQAALRSITFSSSSQAPTDISATRLVTWQILDGAGKPSAVDSGSTTTITITPANDAPTITNLPNPQLLHDGLWMESAKLFLVAPNATLGDADDTRLSSLTVMLAGTGLLGPSEGLVLEGIAATTGSMLPGSDWTAINVNGTGINAAYSAATGILTLGNAAITASYEQVVHLIAYGNLSDDPTGTGSAVPRALTWSITDANGDGSGAATSIPALSYLTVMATADAPRLSGLSGTALSFTEGGTLTLGGSIVVQDDDDTQLSQARVWIGSGFTSGDTLNFTNQNGISGSYDSATGILTLTGVDTLAHYQTALRSITFTSGDDPTSVSAHRAINWVLVDANSDDMGFTPSETATVLLNVTATADAPVLTPGTNAGYTEGGSALAFSSGLILTDADDTRITGATITISSGRVTGDVLALPTGFAATSGISGSYNPSNGVLTLTGTATVAQYQEALRAVTFTSSAVNPGTSRTISWSVADGNSDGLGAQNGTNTSSITVTPVNAAPVLTAGSSLSFTEGGSASVIDSGITLTDADDTQMSGATVTISSGYAAGDVLGVTTAGSITVGSNSNGVLTLTGAGTKAQYQSVLRSVTFRNTGDDPTANGASRTITWAVTDANTDAVGAQTNVAVTSTIQVTATADVPVVAGNPGSLSYAEGGAAIPISPALALTDGDDTHLVLASVQIDGKQTGDVLQVTTTGTDISAHFNVDTGLLTLSGTDTKANYQAVLRSVTFHSTSTDPTAGGTATSRTFRWTVRDANSDSLGAQSSVSVSTTLTVSAANALPQLATPQVNTAYYELDPATALNSGISLSDSDSTQLSGATVTISSGKTSGDLLEFTSQNGIAGTYDANTGVLTLSGDASLSHYQLALRSVTFRSTSIAPTLSSATRTIRWAVTDKDASAPATSEAVTSTVTITPSNDKPTQSLFATTVDTTTEDTEVEITLAELMAQGDEADVDGVVNGYKVNSVASGSLRIGTAAGSATAWAADSNDVIDATHKAYWTPGSNANGTLNAFAVVARDDGGAVSETALTATVAVTAVADSAVVTGVGMPMDGVYGEGTPLDFTVTFDHAITVNTSGGIPTLSVTLQSGETVQAQYVAGSGTNDLVFRYSVISGEFDTDGITLGSAVVANGGTLTNVDDAQTMNAALTLHGVGASGGVLVDAVAPAVESVSATAANGNVTYTVTLTKDVTGLDSSAFELSASSNVRATLQSVSGSGRVYAVTMADVGGSGEVRLNLRGHSGIRDSAGNVMSNKFVVAQLFVEAGDTQEQTSNNAPPSNGQTSNPQPNLPPAPAPASVVGGNSGDTTSVITLGNISGTGATSSSLPVLRAVRGETNDAQALGMHTVIREAGPMGRNDSATALSGSGNPVLSGQVNISLSSTAALVGAPALAPMLSAPTDGGFRVAVVADAVKTAALGEIVVAKPIGVVEATNGVVSFTVPTDAFAVAKADTQVTLSAIQANGQALPSWMNFNPTTGKFEGTPPPGAKAVEIKLIARDKNGREAVQVIKIEVKGGAVRDGNASAGKPGEAPVAKGQKTGFNGRPGLTQQLAAARLSNTAHMAGLAKALTGKVA